MKCPARSRGFTLVEAMVSAGVLMLLMASVMVILNTAVQSIETAKIRAVAAQVAQDRMELAHNVTYANLGTVGGIPNGTLPQTETVTVGGNTFGVETAVVYVDDPSDGSAPTDPVPTDYKRVRVEVTLRGAFRPGSSVVLWSDIAPKGLETMVNAGTLSVLVFNSVGIPIQNATVTITAATTTPPVNLTTYTDALGMVMLPGAPICNECYQISATKAGFTTDRTHGTNEVANPLNPHASVLNGQLTNKSLTIDVPATLTIHTVHDASWNYGNYQGVGVEVQGTKEIGRTVTDDPVYKYDAQFVSAFGGLITINNLEWDSYKVIIPTGSSVKYGGSTPTLPVTIAPNSTATVTMVLVPATPRSYWAALEDQSEVPLASGSVQLTNLATQEIATKSVGLPGRPDQGQVYFANLVSGLYSLIASSTGYLTATASVNLVGDIQDIFLMQPQ